MATGQAEFEAMLKTTIKDVTKRHAAYQAANWGVYTVSLFGFSDVEWELENCARVAAHFAHLWQRKRV